MSHPRIKRFEDIKVILDQALAYGGGEYVLPSHGAAVYWRQRAYRFRKLYAEHIDPNSPYDRLVFDAPVNCTVRIRVIEAIGTFIPAAGAPVITEEEAMDPLLQAAIDLAKDLDT